MCKHSLSVTMRIYLKTKDFSVSQEEFALYYDAELEMLITQPQPENLERYYKSEYYISHTDAKTTFADKLYQKAKRINLQRKIKVLHRLGYSTGTLLDIGAGTGDFLAVAKTYGFDWEGVEPNANARALAAEKGIALHQKLSDLPAKTFDVITLWHVLEHLPDVQEQIRQITALLKKDGVLIVAVPNYNSYDAQYYGAYWAAYDVPRHLWHFSRTAIAKLFARQRMEVVATRPMLLDAFYVAMLSEKYKGSKGALLRAFCMGLWSNLKACFTKEYSSLLYALKKQ